MLGEGAEGLGGGDASCEAGVAEGRSGGGDELGEGFGGAVFVEDGFVADDDHLDGAPVSGGPGGDFGNLGFAVGEAVFGNEDPEHKAEVVRFGGRSDVLETGAVGAVEADGAKAFGSNDGDIGGHGGSIFA